MFNKLALMPRVVNKHKSDYEVYIGRGSWWGNPYTHKSLKGTKATHKCSTLEESIYLYALDLISRFKEDPDGFIKKLRSLEGMKLGCFCKPKPCHGDVIVLFYETLIVFDNDLNDIKDKVDALFKPENITGSTD